MNRKYLYAISGILLSMLILTSPAALAKGSGKGHDWSLSEKLFHKAHFILSNKDEIGLSEKQVNAIKTIKREAKKKLIMQEAEIDVIKVDVKSELYENPVDLEKVNGLIDKKYDVKKAKAKSLAKSFAELKSTLSEDQWGKLRALWKK